MSIVSKFSRTTFSGRFSTFAKDIYRSLDVPIKDSNCLFVIVSVSNPIRPPLGYYELLTDV
jgi:hypothetical protein